MESPEYEKGVPGSGHSLCKNWEAWETGKGNWQGEEGVTLGSGEPGRQWP